MSQDSDDISGEVRSRAVGFLSRREHSRRELALKLARVTSDKLVVEREIARLAEQGLQSDQRFAEALVRHRSGRGFGPMRLLAEFREHGLDPSVVDSSAPEWREAAATARRKRFGASLPGSPREVARQMRFLQYRGFTSDQARHALDGRGIERE